MKRMAMFAAILGTAALSMTVAASQAPQQQNAPKVVEVQKVRENLFMLTGGGGNSAVYVGTNGVTVVDTKNPGWGAPILEKIKTLTNKPVTLIINTHTHGDHVSGNVEFPASVDVVVHENTKKNMEKLDIFKTSGGIGLAKRTFQDRMTVGSGNDRLELYYFGRGHTDGDAWIVFPSLRVVHAGDIFSGKNLPLLDVNNGGSGIQIGESLSKAADGLKDVDTIITGHSTLMTPADLREYAQFNKDFVADIRAAVAAGKTPDQIASTWKINDKYKNYNIAEARLKTNVQTIADELKK